MKTRLITLAGVAALAAAPGFAKASGSFDLLALPHSFFPGAVYVSADGGALTGWNNFYWTEAGGYRFAADGSFAGVSGDGSTVIGTFFNTSGEEVAGTWTPDGGWVEIARLPGGEACGSSVGAGYALNSDASIAVGLAWVANCRAEAFMSTGGVTVGLGHADGASSRATDISDDGTTIVGFDESPTYGNRRPALWNGAVSGPQHFAGEETVGEALAVSSDGSKVCGQANGTAFYYTPAGGLVDLGAFPDEPWGSTAAGVADDGTVVGWSGDPFFSLPKAFIWTAATGMQPLASYLTAMSVDVAGCYLYTATSISADGTTIAGTAIDASGFWFVPYVVHLPSDQVPLVSDVPALAGKASFTLLPNPFQTATQLSFQAPTDGPVRALVYDLAGRQVRVLFEGETLAAGRPIAWDGRDDAGRALPAGTYLVRVIDQRGEQVQKVARIR
ncbi:MAG: FlgD immunoglobulin-like domain containing protein [Candidatus Eisenbacteria bacterium]